MTKRVFSLVLAIVMLLQILVPQTIIAKEEVKSPSDKQVQIGLINGNSYDSKLMQELNRLTAKSRRKRAAEPGISLFGYFEDGQEPKDEDKLKYHGEVKADLTVRGIDGNPFQWKDVFGTEEVHLRFIQINDETDVETGTERVLNINQAGKYTWTDGEGNPAELPLFNNKLEPLTYEVKLDEEVSDKVKLLTARLTTTGNAGSPTFEKPDAEGRIKYHLTLEIGLQQVASSKFVSEWHTAVVEGERPQLEATMTGSMNTGKSKTISFNLPTKDGDEVIVRTASRRDKNKFIPEFLYKKPTTDIKTDTAGLTFDTANKTVKSDKHKYKYDFNYDVINGGKLTMAEILTVTFDANGGKFASITDENVEQKIVKEVDYGKDLADKPANPTKDRETFKGWSTTEEGKTPATDADFKNITKAKTFYAIWDNNDIVADQLEVKESFKDGTGYVNDFIPTLETLKGQVKIKGANGTPQALANDDTFAIVDGSKEYTADSDELKNYLYGLLQEKDNPSGEPTRTVNVKAKVTFSNKKSKTVDIPIKVIKNIYEAKTLTEKPYYVPSDYVKVTVDPTTKAQYPQKTYYYVNPKAEVVIPGSDPVGVDGNTFTKWLIDGTDTEYKLKDKPRHKFENETTIKAQYSKDVIPQEGDTKPEGVPDNFVKVTFVPTDNGTMEGAKIFWVNPEKEVTIPVKDPVGKQYFTFKKWKMGEDAKGDKYTPSTPKQFTEATTITATYDEAKNIIPYNPKEPTTRPDGYVRVTFAADPGLKLTEQKAYYVKKNASIKLGNTEFVKPGYEAQTGYKFDKWDKEDTTVIEANDIVVTAKATKLDNVVPKTKDDGTENKQPEGYITVTFKTTDKAGSVEKIVYINPNKAVELTSYAPEVKPITGYEFADWDRPIKEKIQYNDNDVITAKFNEKGALIPNKSPDGTENKQPDGYKTVTFVIDPTTGGKIADGEVKVYYVNPDKEVTVPQPKTQAETGYEFDKWKIGNQEFPTEAKKYTDNTTVKGKFTKLPDIVPSSDKQGKPNAKPEGYVTVTFDKGANGKSIEGQTVYYVNPKVDPAKTLGDPTIVKPEVKAETGYKFKSWNYLDTKAITSDITVTAQYDSIDDVIPKENQTGGENKQPDGYITVTFEKGANGELEGNTIFYLNPNKAVVLEGKAPTIKPNTGYTSAGWDTTINKAIQYKDGDKITALYNKLGDVIPQEKTDGSDKPAGYFTVTFDKGANGELTGKTVYYVKPNTEVTVPAPTVKPAVGYEFSKWDKELTQTFTKDTTITAGYKTLDDIIPQKNTDGSDKTDGYHTVTFKPDANGTLSGTTVYYVKPNVDIDLTDTAKAITKNPNTGYTAEDGTWKPAIAKQQYTADAEYEFNFKALSDVIEKIDENTKKPDGYVTVKLIPTGKATDKTEKVYFVNPLKDNVTIPSTDPVGNEITDSNGNTYTFLFKEWIVIKGTITPAWKQGQKIIGTFKQDTDIAAKYNVKAEKLVNGPLAKENVVTQINEKPQAKDLIKNIYDSNDPNNKGNLPDGTKFEYEKEPDVSKAGDTTAKVKVTYPNNKTVVVEVPIKVVDNVIPQEGTEKPKVVPDNFVLVEFKSGSNGSLAGTTKYWVKPSAGIKLSDITHPSVTANKEWKNTGWDKDEDTEIKSQLDVTAQYLKKVLTEKPTENIGEYVKVEFKEGEHGTIAADATKTYWVLKNETVSLTVPTVTAKDGYAQKTNEDAWSPKLATSYSNDTTHIAQYVYNGENVIPQKGNDKPNNVPDDFVLVEFKPGDNGSIASTETVKYWVNPTKIVTLTPPRVKANSGYVQERGLGGWDKYLTNIFSEDTTITAQYRKIEVPTPPTPGDPDNPDNPNPGYPGGPDYPYYPGRPIPMYPEVRYETIIQEKIVKVPVPVADNYFKEVRYMQGFNGYFRPNDGLTRAEAAQILANALVEDGYKYNPNFKISYKDVGEAWYTRAVKIVTEAKVFAGYDDGNFKPQAKITRNEWIATLKRFQELGDASGNNMNLRDDHWAKGEIQAAFNEGWLKIYTDGLATYKGDEFIPRQEVAAVSNKAFKRIVDKTYIGKNNLSLVTYKDVNTSMWAYEDILCASNTFLDRKDRYIAHWVKEDKNQFNIDTSDLKIVQKNFQRNPR